MRELSRQHLTHRAGQVRLTHFGRVVITEELDPKISALFLTQEGAEYGKE